MVAINKNTTQTGSRDESLEGWLKRTHETLAFRSKQGFCFHRLYNLLLTKRLIELAVKNVLGNQGASTAGIDGVTRKSLRDSGGIAGVVNELHKELVAKTYQPQPVRRVYIPKSNGDKRPLGIPTIKDRVVQEMLRLILEPIYEVKFYRHSYGFRPFRSTHHAALRIKDLMGRHNYNYAIEGDIRKCFDRVHHEKLVGILRQTIKDERIIKLVRQMLKAGVMEDGSWQITDEGTPQGGILSPLLANIYLNELDWFVHAKWEAFSQVEQNKLRRHKTARPCHLIRYADDFVVLLKGTQEQAEELKAQIAQFLQQELHLELSEEKTLITASTTGIDYLGFHIRKYKQVSLITPSRKAIARFKEQVRIRAWKGFSIDDETGIVQLNQYITGWGMYYRYVSSARVYRSLDNYVWWRVWYTTHQLRTRGNPKRRNHYLKHYIAYKFDINQKNRWRRGRNYGAWANEEQSAAYIVVRLSFIPIRYIEFHPQLNPYLPQERKLLDMRKKLNEFLAEYQHNEPQVNWQYGAEWKVVRLEVLRRAGHHCQKCNTSINGRTAQVHHLTPLKQAKSRRQANYLENLLALCPKCHAQMEQESKTEKQV